MNLKKSYKILITLGPSLLNKIFLQYRCHTKPKISHFFGVSNKIYYKIEFSRRVYPTRAVQRED